jgi:hypothetical protein
MSNLPEPADWRLRPRWAVSEARSTRSLPCSASSASCATGCWWSAAGSPTWHGSAVHQRVAGPDGAARRALEAMVTDFDLAAAERIKSSSAPPTTTSRRSSTSSRNGSARSTAGPHGPGVRALRLHLGGHQQPVPRTDAASARDGCCCRDGLDHRDPGHARRGARGSADAVPHPRPTGIADHTRQGAAQRRGTA